MILRELFYFDKESLEPIEDKSYDASMDDSIMKKNTPFTTPNQQG